jgi:GMP synthase-like glutamine amidotransferase
MILYIVTEPEAVYRTGNWQKKRLALEVASGDFCLTVHYKQVSLNMLKKVSPWAICHSGGGTPYEDYDILQDARYRQVVLRSPIPQLGICGGHQLMATIHGGTLGIMRRLTGDDADHNPAYHPGEYKEWGVYPIQVLRPHPLFAGCGKTVRVQQFHRSEVKTLGDDWKVLASSPACRVQAIEHRRKPFYGVQFHPEDASEAYPDGFRVLRNFFKLAASRQR